jgi:hypothetical protein
MPVWSGINLPAFQRNLLLPSLRQKNTIMKKAERSSEMLENV